MTPPLNTDFRDLALQSAIGNRDWLDDASSHLQRRAGKDTTYISMSNQKSVTQDAIYDAVRHLRLQEKTPLPCPIRNRKTEIRNQTTHEAIYVFKKNTTSTSNQKSDDRNQMTQDAIYDFKKSTTSCPIRNRTTHEAIYDLEMDTSLPF
ncbi:hypothetical protein Ahia01_000962100 [Argonauta hians]